MSRITTTGERMPGVPDVPLDGLYGERIMDHYRNPRNRVQVLDPSLETEEFNPFCGDRVNLQLSLDGQGRVSLVGTHAEGCSIIQATASMMGEALWGKTLAELEDLSRRFRAMMRGNQPADGAAEPVGDLESLQVVRRYPVRIKCALLPWVALEEGIRKFRSRTG